MVSNENEIYFNSIKSYYNSLDNMYIKNNCLYYESYVLPLIFNLKAINPQFFQMNEKEIIDVLYIYQLLFKPSLDENEITLIKNFADKYLEINKIYIENSYNNENKDTIAASNFGFSIPILLAYDDNFNNSPGAKILKDYLNIKYSEAEQNSEGIPYVKVLKNPNAQPLSYEEFSERLNDIESAAFVNIFLIAFGVMCTIAILIMK